MNSLLLHMLLVTTAATTTLAAPAAKSRAKSSVSSSSILGDLSSATSASATIQSRSGSGGRFAPTNNFNSGGSSYNRPVTTTNSYSTPSAPAVRDGGVKILPLPIPVGLPVPVPQYGYGHGGGYGGGGQGPFSFGLFGGFGGPLGGFLKDNKNGGGLPPLGFGGLGGLGGGGLDGLGFNPIKASIVAGKSNPFIHLLAAPYIKNVRENNGEDLPTLDDLQELLERSSFGLSDIEQFQRMQ